MEYKTCSKCGRLLPSIDFYRRKNGKLTSQCKECTRKSIAEKYRKTHTCKKEYVSIMKEAVPLENEIWKTISLENNLICVSSFGRIARRDMNDVMYLYSQVEDKCGYLRINNSNIKEVFVHRLVVKAFISDIPQGMEVNHKDGNKRNNRVDNLEIVTHKENMVHSRYVLGHDSSGMRGKFGKEHHLSKAVRCYTLDGIFVKEYGSIREAARELHLSDINIIRVCKGYPHRKTCGGYIWKYSV